MRPAAANGGAGIKAQDKSSTGNDTITQSLTFILPLEFEALYNPSKSDTSLAIQRFTFMINNDLFQSLYINPNRNTKRGDSAYDHSRTKNYKGLFKYNHYTIYNSRTDGVIRVNYWHSGEDKVSLSRTLNVIF